MNILALDLGTATGYCYNREDELRYGHWDLATKREVTAWGKERLTRRRDPRPQRLCDDILKQEFVPDLIVFEDVMFASSTLQVQLWSALRTSLWMCLGDFVRFDCVNVKTLKAFACRGDATKQQMRVALDKAAPEWKDKPLTEDEVDAIWIHRWAKHNLSRTPVQDNERGWLKQVLDDNRTRKKL